MRMADREGNTNIPTSEDEGRAGIGPWVARGDGSGQRIVLSHTFDWLSQITNYERRWPHAIMLAP